MKKEKDLKSNLIFHLEKAIENEEFTVYYQPIIHTISGSLCGFEALVRWNHPEYGFLNPYVFIESLEDMGQIHHLDIHVIESVCKRYRKEVDEGRSVVPFSVNLSCQDFETVDVYAIIHNLCKKYGVPEHMLNIEITERTFAENISSVSSTIAKLRKAGFQVWMDDFGSGYSSLNTLKEYELDELKIDMGFLSDLSDKSKNIIGSIISMAKRLNMVTLMEGVESKEQYDFLKLVGCDRLQGFYFSKPLPYDEVVKVLNEKGIVFESDKDRLYYHEINRINLLSPSPFLFTDSYKDYNNSVIPLAIVEIDDSKLEYIYENESFKDHLSAIGASNANETIQKLNHFGIISRDKIDTFIKRVIDSKKEEKIDFTINGDICSAKAKLISRNDDKYAILLSINNITKAMDINHEKLMDQKLKNIYAVYLRVSILRPEKDELISVFEKEESFIKLDVIHSLHEVINDFAAQKVAKEDKDKYLIFLDQETLLERVHQSKSGFINTKIHTMDSSGNYSNKMYMAVPMGNNEIMLLVRYANL